MEVVTNEIITGVWGGIFTLNALLGALAIFAFAKQGLFVELLLTGHSSQCGRSGGNHLLIMFPSLRLPQRRSGTPRRLESVQMGGGVEAVAIAGIHAANEVYKN